MPSSIQGTASETERLKIQSSVWKRFLRQFGCELRVAEPGIIQSFNADQTVTVQLAITEKIILDGLATLQTIPPLPQVPLIMPRFGGWMFVASPKAGDECLVIFADMSIEDWWQSGGVSNQIGSRRHDLNDGFAILGPWNQTRLIENFPATSAQLRSEDESVMIDLAADGITIKAPKVSIVAPVITAGDTTGTPLPVVTGDFLTWFTINITPFLKSKGYLGPPPPATSASKVFEAE